MFTVTSTPNLHRAVSKSLNVTFDKLHARSLCPKNVGKGAQRSGENPNILGFVGFLESGSMSSWTWWTVLNRNLLLDIYQKKII